ncbi:hypothetical protein KP001_11735 [Geomonas subterranea]|uniref:Lipoprotein n=1 Tax=Geomonas subterranea TaxID=2847989 RepID=A0ABX8LAW8_9BACT|nr:hypothetical protein [Geomonas subterranea]QXE89137.1 hypothetical protein KP001_11735 [Geomonas subterranea]QXM08746.1 hypothetical protein KP002_17540 [Geomonas subterranea]
MSFRTLSLLLAVPVVAGCAIGVPQNRQEFVEMYKDAKVFGKAEHYIINRPAKTVTTDVKAFAQKCLNVRVVDPPNYALKETGGSTTFRPRFESVGKDTNSLTLQEEYNDSQMSGAPRGGIYTLVAEIRPAGKNKTELDIYHARRGKISEPLKQWADGDKCACPSLNRGW